MKNLKKFESVFEDLPESWEPDIHVAEELSDHIVMRLGIDYDLDVEELPYNKSIVIKIGRRVLNSVMSGCSVLLDKYILKVGINHANNSKQWVVDLNVSGDKFNTWSEVYDELHEVVAHWFFVDREVIELQKKTQDKFYELPEVTDPSVKQYLQPE